MKRILLLVVIGLVAIQLVPYGRSHTNPPVRQEPSWDSPQTKALAERACFDCHSNQTKWPAYANIAPSSWLVQHDVDEGRENVNFSEWDRPQKNAGDAVKEVQEGEMPPWQYTILHPEARLSDAETRQLVEGLRATLAQSGYPEAAGEGR